MKNIFKIAIIFMLIFASCNEDEFLTETPKDDIFAENLFQDYDGFINGLNGLYANVRQKITRAGNNNKIPTKTNATMLWKAGVDNAFLIKAKNQGELFNDYNLLNPESDMIVVTWEWLYRIINISNTIIEYAEGDVNWQGGSAEGSKKNKNKVIAHARLIRAWAYRHLTGCWGDVPLNIQSGEGYRSDWERTPVSEIQSVMEQDWIFARDNLDMVEMTGFANSAVASHYLAELYLTQGRFSESVNEAKRVINSGEYHLMTEGFGRPYSHIPNPPDVDSCVVFMDLFANPSREDGNMEVLWTFNNSHETIDGSMNGGSKSHWNGYATKIKSLKKLDSKILFRYNGGRGRARAGISDSAFAWYEPNDDRFSKYAIKKFYVYPQNEENETDFEIVEYTKIEYDTRDDLEKSYIWPWPRKYEYIDPLYPENADNAYSHRSQMYVRLADTYLILAEALHKDGKDQEAANYINEIRQRSNASLITASDVSIEFILKERSRELMTEEARRYALTRNGLLVDWTVKYNPMIEGIGTHIFEHNNLLPLPQTVIDANTDLKMEQNPGYN